MAKFSWNLQQRPIADLRSSFKMLLLQLTLPPFAADERSKSFLVTASGQNRYWQALS